MQILAMSFINIFFKTSWMLNRKLRTKNYSLDIFVKEKLYLRFLLVLTKGLGISVGLHTRTEKKQQKEYDKNKPFG